MDDDARGEVTVGRARVRRTWAGAALAACAFAVSLGSAAPQKQAKPTKPAPARLPTPSPTPRLAIRVEIEQEGRAVPIADHRAVLERAPFDIVLTLAAGESVALRASSGADVFEDARRGLSLGRTFNPAQSGAEEAGNPDRDLWVDVPVQHALSYDPKSADHRFNEVVPRGGLYRCRRSVAQLGIKNPVAVESYASPSLYLVFLAGPPSQKYVTTLETAREFLMLVFEDATADLPPPTPPSKQGPMESLLAFVFAKDLAAVKAYLPEAVRAQASQRSPVEQQMFYEALRFAESTRARGGRVERGGKASKPEIRFEISDSLAGRAVCDQEHIEGDRASIQCKVRSDRTKEDKPFRVRMIAQQGRWRLGGLEDGAGSENVWSHFEDGQIVARLEAMRRRGNESGTIMDLRSLISAEMYVTSVNGGFFLPPQCLEALEGCIPGYTGPPAVEPPFPWVTPRYGYRLTFKAGPRPSIQDLKKATASASSVYSFAFVAVPEAYGKSGARGFCGDATGVICQTQDGSAPAVRDGVCAQPCSLLQ